MNKSKTNSVSRPSQSIKKKRNLILDVNAPKRPSGAYIIYATKGYKDFVSTHPEIKDKSKIMTAMAEHWKNLSDEEKKPYTDVAQANRNEYEKKLQEYKQTDVYRNFIENKKQMQKKAQSNKKKNKQSIDDNPEPVVSTRDGEISVFSQEFIEHNKKRQGYLQRIRREIADIDEEESLIRKNIERLQSKYGDLHVSNRADDHSSKMNEKILSRWRGLVINALESAKLLDSLHLNKESSVDDVIKSLEEASKKPNDQIKNCLNAINFG